MLNTDQSGETNPNKFSFLAPAGGVGSGSVSGRSAIACHEARFFKLVEWSEQLRSVTSVWLGAAATAFKSDSAPAGV